MLKLKVERKRIGKKRRVIGISLIPSDNTSKNFCQDIMFFLISSKDVIKNIKKVIELKSTEIIFSHPQGNVVYSFKLRKKTLKALKSIFSYLYTIEHNSNYINKPGFSIITQNLSLLSN
jgi:hypothetical protein